MHPMIKEKNKPQESFVYKNIIPCRVLGLQPIHLQQRTAVLGMTCATLAGECKGEGSSHKEKNPRGRYQASLEFQLSWKRDD
ncbi:hypothetical protein DXF96_17765 [Heyndrickxia coagulans]|nr:hypothetical protein C3766_12240 [Heyndrickxia coagulans]AWP37703.1 hypothetical protein CYJ15_12245 [Heyndrickxia coagulans]QDI63205.1 hypothetical protein DXF96_17765 [Heyndrickxia coagulans]